MVGGADGRNVLHAVLLGDNQSINQPRFFDLVKVSTHTYPIFFSRIIFLVVVVDPFGRSAHSKG